MDELKIKTGFFKTMLSNLIEKSLRKIYGDSIYILLQDLEISHKDGKVVVHVDLTGSCSPEVLTKVIFGREEL